MRGDTEPIRIGARTNIQDGCVLHADPGYPVVVGEGCVVGHRAVVHGCEIGDGCLIGMSATILNGAKIGEGSIVAAGALVLASESFAERRCIEPLGTIVAHAKVAEEPPNLHSVPGNAGKLVLEKAGWSADDLDLVEINEAFAAVAINSSRILGVSEEIVNVNGGAVSLGHPIGASGARILMTLFYELKRRGGGRGVAAICSGGGQGDAVLAEV